MARGAAFELVVVTPEAAALECDATFVALPAHDGEIGVLRNRAPLLCKLDAGRLRVETEEGTSELYIDGGFAEMVGNRLTVLTQAAVAPDALDHEKAVAAMTAAKAMKVGDDHSFEERQRALRRARAQLKMSR
jgi:F-type H+-transporting ATPase subunit epsilon